MSQCAPVVCEASRTCEDGDARRSQRVGGTRPREDQQTTQKSPASVPARGNVISAHLQQCGDACGTLSEQSEEGQNRG